MNTVQSLIQLYETFIQRYNDWANGAGFSSGEDWDQEIDENPIVWSMPLHTPPPRLNYMIFTYDREGEFFFSYICIYVCYQGSFCLESTGNIL